MKKTRKLKIAAIVSAAVIGILALTLALGLVGFTSSSDYINLDLKKIRFEKSTLIVTDAHGKAIDRESSGLVRLSELNNDTKNAFLAVEDSRFYKHGGVDVKGVLRALAKNISAGKFIEGGSTITQQLIKNTHLSGEKTVRRKANEFLLACQLEKTLSKDEIFEAYLNTAYFGNNCYGIAAASGFYFGKSADKLTLSESATLAGMLRSPNIYAPNKNIEKAKERRDIALNCMLKNGFIDEAAAEKARTQKLSVAEHSPNIYVKSAILEACGILGVTEAQLSRGYKIETYFDAETAKNLEKALRSDNSEYGFVPQKLAFVIDNATNGISAIAGNVESIFAVKRQAGSLLKPLAVYAPAIEIDAVTVATPVLDEEIAFGAYKPQNFGGNFAGWTTVSDALAQSLNIPAIKTLNMIGVGTARRYLAANGIALSGGDDNLTLALGTVTEGVTPTALADGYATLANGGKYRKSGTVKAIWLNGTKIYQHDTEKTKVFSPETAYLTTYMLKKTAKSGTSKALKDVGFDVAAKTGTVGGKGNSDLYMCGYTSEQTFFVWIGDKESRLDSSLSSGKVCGNICLNYLSNLKKRPENFGRPAGIVSVALDKEALENKHILKQAHYLSADILIVPMKKTDRIAY